MSLGPSSSSSSSRGTPIQVNTSYPAEFASNRRQSSRPVPSTTGTAAPQPGSGSTSAHPESGSTASAASQRGRVRVRSGRIAAAPFARRCLSPGQYGKAGPFVTRKRRKEAKPPACSPGSAGGLAARARTGSCIRRAARLNRRWSASSEDLPGDAGNARNTRQPRKGGVGRGVGRQLLAARRATCCLGYELSELGTAAGFCARTLQTHVASPRAKGFVERESLRAALDGALSQSNLCFTFCNVAFTSFVGRLEMYTLSAPTSRSLRIDSAQISWSLIPASKSAAISRTGTGK